MIVLATSAIFAVLADEPERPAFVDAIAGADQCLISAATRLEIGIVVTARYGITGCHYLSTFLSNAGVKTCPLDQAQSDTAITAYHRYGKGRHPAGLSFGACFSYALARITNAPLLFKGNGFSQTDILRVV